MDHQNQHFFEDLLEKGNYLGAYHYLKSLEIPKEEKSALMGSVIQAIVQELSSQPRSNKERIIFLRSVLNYALKEYPGLAGMYREHIRLAQGKEDFFSDVFKGVRNAADVVTGRKTLEEGFEDAAEDVKETFEGAVGTSWEDMARDAEKTLKQGIDQIFSFFSQPAQGKKQPSDEETEEEQDQPSIRVKVENADDPMDSDIHDAEKLDD